MLVLKRWFPEFFTRTSCFVKFPKDLDKWILQNQVCPFVFAEEIMLIGTSSCTYTIFKHQKYV